MQGRGRLSPIFLIRRLQDSRGERKRTQKPFGYLLCKADHYRKKCKKHRELCLHLNKFSSLYKVPYKILYQEQFYIKIKFRQNVKTTGKGHLPGNTFPEYKEKVKIKESWSFRSVCHTRIFEVIHLFSFTFSLIRYQTSEILSKVPRAERNEHPTRMTVRRFFVTILE